MCTKEASSNIISFQFYYEPVICLQLRVLAEDGGNPRKSATTTVLVAVNRNIHAPRFEPQRIDLPLLETAPLGIAIVRVNATDRDTKVEFIFMNDVNITCTCTTCAM